MTRHPYPALPIAQRDRPRRPRTPCHDGFHWIGQSFACCDRCGLPAWDHEGFATLDPAASPFGSGGWSLRRWEPGEADRIRAKSDPEMPVWECGVCRALWARDPDDPDLAPPEDLEDHPCGWEHIKVGKRGPG